jgi:hypothetical protein
MTGSNTRVVFQKDPHSKRILVIVVNLMLVATLGNDGMETIEQLHASINVAQVTSISFQREDVLAMNVKREEVMLGRPKDQYD